MSALATQPLGHGMKDMVPLLARIALGHPLAYAHYNDGEARAAASATGTCCQIRGDPKSGQMLSERLQTLMRAAIGTNVENFIVGLPCTLEFASMKTALQRHLPPKGNSRLSESTSSTILINANYAIAHALLPAILQKRNARVHLFVSDAANATAFAEKTGIHPASVQTLPLHAAFPVGYDGHVEAWRNFQPGDIAILCAGPVGRLLAPEWFRNAPKTTVLELGSFFDPELDQPITAGTPYQMHPDTWKPSCEFDGDRAAELSNSEHACMLEVASLPAAPPRLAR